ncbi:cysteine desulfurase [Luteitalea sp. TBR-22]|uniref:cysteine desulfurase n=1 Tax=Luteitalea sp. TBR-22 TaxID=2802971 RepID=UPI001EF3EF7A
MFDADAVRREFPILDQQVHGKPLVYLDNANTTQKPLSVIEALDHYYRADNANIHRATHLLSERATKAYEGARQRIARFFNARETEEIVFTRGCTEAINLVAHAYARPRLQPGDEILVTRMEHHSNIVPWQIVAQQTGAVLRVVPMDEHGVLDMAAFERLLGPKTRLVSVIHVSNALGTVNPVREVIRLAKAQGVPVLLDGAQAAPHMPVDVRELDCDFYACSAHKMYGPTGIGALYGRRALLESMPPWMGGGDMIASVTFEHTEYNEIPYKFEAGTPNIAGVVGFGTAVDFLSRFDLREVAAHEHDLLTHATEALSAIDGIRIVGQAPERAGVVSFLVGDVHPHDVGTFLDQDGVAVRTGQHCAQPVMDFYGITSTVRASFGLYNTHADVDALVASVKKVQAFFS